MTTAARSAHPAHPASPAHPAPPAHPAGAATAVAPTGSAVVVATDATFAQEVLSADLPVLVEFTAAWCPPCRMIAPVLAEIAAEEAHRLRVVEIDVDHNPVTQAAYGVMSMPTLLLFRGGQPVKVLVGARPKRRLLQELADAI